MAPDNAGTRKPRSRGSSGAGTRTNSQSKHRQAQVQLICTLVGAVVAVLGLVVAGFTYLLPRAAPSAGPTRIPSSAGQSTVVVSTDLQALACSEAGALKSTATNDKTIIEFVNHSSKTILLYWIDYVGIRQSYGKLAPDELLAFNTYPTHPWLVSDASGQCIAIFLPAKKPGQALIQ